MTIKNHEGSEILTYSRANNLACHHYIDAGKRHTAPRLEKKESW